MDTSDRTIEDWARLVVPFTLEHQLFPDWEIHALLGFDYHRVEEIAAHLEREEPLPAEMVRNIFSLWNSVIGYPHGKQAELEEHTGLDQAAQRRAFLKLKQEHTSASDRSPP